MPKIKINENEFYYEVHGKGEPLVLVAGFSADHFIWAPILKSFAENYQVIIFDNRGIGQSSAPNYPYTVDMMAEDVVELCNQLGIRAAHFLGNSMGGAIVQTIGYKYPELVKSLIFSNTFIKTSNRLNLQFEAYLELRRAKAPIKSICKSVIAEVYSADFLSKEGVPEALMNAILNNPYPMSDDAYASQLHACGTFDSNEWLHKIASPTLIIYSDDDLLVNLNSSRELLVALPNADSYCFTSAGHLPHIEKPDLFVEVVNKFLNQVS